MSTATLAAPGARFRTLDGLRGIAALAVVWWHFHEWHTFGSIFAPPLSYLAVDFFFLLSGFVIAASYERRLAGGLGFASFARRRLIRLYPLYLLGSVAGGAVAILTLSAIPQPPALVGTSLLAMVPLLSGPAKQAVFPLDSAAWSLSLELLVNGAFALGAWKLPTRGLLAICFASAAVLALCCWLLGNINLGWSIENYWGGFPRVLFSFGAGVVLFRLHRSGALPRWRCHPAVPACALIAALNLPADGSFAAVLPLIVVGVLNPAVLIASIGTEPSQRIGAACDFAGELSYPLYTLHPPLLLLAGAVAPALAAGWPPGLAAFACSVAAGAISWIALTLFDEPVRRWLSARPVGADIPRPVSAASSADGS